MRICLYQTMPRSGIAFYGHRLAEALGADGHKVDLLTTDQYEYESTLYTVCAALRPFGTSSNKVLRKLSSLWAYWAHINFLLRWVRRSDKPYDVVHIQVPYIVFHWIFIPLLRRYCRVVVGTIHDVIPHQPILGPRLDRLLSQWTFSAFDRVIVHSEENKRQLLSAFRVDPGRVTVVPHGVFHYGEGARTTVPAWESNQAITRVLFFGGIRPNKGLPVLLESLKRVKTPAIRLVIAGAGGPADYALITECQRELRGMGVTHEIMWLNRFISDDEIPILFSDCDVVALPYTSFASQSGVLSVAIGYDRPVIVTDVGSMGETVRAFGNGIVIPPGDAEQLAAALKQIHPGSDLFTRMVEAARAARQSLDWAPIAQQTVASAYLHP